jgi:hypothetical protein
MAEDSAIEVLDLRQRFGSGVAAYIPCETSLGSSGIAAELPPAEACEGPGPLLIARDLPVGRIRALRRADAEAWPGAWSADHLAIEEL